MFRFPLYLVNFLVFQMWNFLIWKCQIWWYISYCLGSFLWAPLKSACFLFIRCSFKNLLYNIFLFSSFLSWCSEFLVLIYISHDSNSDEIWGHLFIHPQVNILFATILRSFWWKCWTFLLKCWSLPCWLNHGKK